MTPTDKDSLTVDPAMRAAEWIKCQGYLSRDGKAVPQDVVERVADIIRRETRCDEMRRLLRTAYENMPPKSALQEWFIKVSHVVKEDTNG